MAVLLSLRRKNRDLDPHRFLALPMARHVESVYLGTSETTGVYRSHPYTVQHWGSHRAEVLEHLESADLGSVLFDYTETIVKLDRADSVAAEFREVRHPAEVPRTLEGPERAAGCVVGHVTVPLCCAVAFLLLLAGVQACEPGRRERRMPCGMASLLIERNKEMARLCLRILASPTAGESMHVRDHAEIVCKKNLALIGALKGIASLQIVAAGDR